MAFPQRQLSNFRYRKGLRKGTPPPAPGFAPGPYSGWRASWMGKGLFGPYTGYDPSIQVLSGTLVSGAAAYYNPGVYTVVVQAITAGVNPTVTFDAPATWALGIAQLSNGITCKTGNKGTGLSGVFNKQVTIGSLTSTTCVLNGIDTTGQTYVPQGTPGSLAPGNNFTFIVNVPGDYRSFGTNATPMALADVAAAFPLVNGRYEIRNVKTNLIVIAGASAGSRIPLRIVNCNIPNQNPSSDVQLVNPFTGHLDLTFCDVQLQNVFIDHGTGGINSYSQPLAGGGSSDGVIVCQGATIALAGCTGFFSGYNFDQCAYDGYKLNGQMESFYFEHGTHHRHDSLLGGGHTDGFQITALDNSLLTRETFKYIWIEAGGHSGIYWNDYQGDNVHKIKNNWADSCLFYKGNNGATFSHGRFCAVTNSWFPDLNGDGTPGVPTLGSPMLNCDVGSGDATHGDPEFPVWYGNYRMNNDGSQTLIPQVAALAAWRSGAGQLMGAYPV